MTIVLTNGDTFSGDGYNRTATMLINGTYPGPLIRGSWGDWFEITVINRLTNCNGSSIHWHGIRQWNSVWSDGVAGVTQCPIPVCQLIPIPNLPDAMLLALYLALRAALCGEQSPHQFLVLMCIVGYLIAWRTTSLQMACNSIRLKLVPQVCRHNPTAM